MAASFSFTGFDPGRLFAGVEAYGDLALDEAAGEMATLGLSLATRMQEELLRAITPTGAARVAAGRGQHAGRYESGRMHDAIDYDLDIDREARIITLRWGWIQEWVNYFAYQEWGTQHIEAVGSLGTTYSWGIMQLRGILSGMANQ